MKSYQIKGAFSHAKITAKAVAEKLETTPQNLSLKINRETLTDDELNRIAEIIGAKYICCFVFDDGTQI